MNEVPIPEVRVGQPTRCGALAVLPLYPERTLLPDRTCDYALAHEAIAAGTLIVREVSEEGSVWELMVENRDKPVLFIEGEEVCGGRQNRVLCSSTLVAGRSRTHIPVVCTQFGRWEHDKRQFASGSQSPPSLRHVLKEGRRPDQSRIWTTIRQEHQRLGVQSQSENLSDALTTHRDRVDDLRCRLPYPRGASGIVVVLGGKVVAADVFDKPSTLKKLWDRLVQGVALDALEFCGTGCQADDIGKPVRLYKEMVRNMKWRQVDSVGLGEAYRATDDDSLATALVVDGVAIHVSVSMPTMG